MLARTQAVVRAALDDDDNRPAPFPSAEEWASFTNFRLDAEQHDELSQGDAEVLYDARVLLDLGTETAIASDDTNIARHLRERSADLWHEIAEGRVSPEDEPGLLDMLVSADDAEHGPADQGTGPT